MPAAPPVDRVDDLTPLVRDSAERIERLTYTVDEALAALGIGRATFYAQLIDTGRLRTVMVGSRRLIPRTALLELLGEGA